MDSFIRSDTLEEQTLQNTATSSFLSKSLSWKSLLDQEVGSIDTQVDVHFTKLNERIYELNLASQMQEAFEECKLSIIEIILGQEGQQSSIEHQIREQKNYEFLKEERAIKEANEASFKAQVAALQAENMELEVCLSERQVIVEETKEQLRDERSEYKLIREREVKIRTELEEQDESSKQ